MSVSALKRARRFSGSWVRLAKYLRFSSGVTLESHRGGRSCGFPMSKGTIVKSRSSPPVARVAVRLVPTRRVVSGEQADIGSP